MTKYEIILFEIKKKLKEKGLTVTAVSKELGLERSGFSHRLNNNGLRLTELLKICDLLGLEVTITEKKGNNE